MTQFLKTKEEIHDWLNRHDVKNYVVLTDLSVDVKGDVNLIEKKLDFIPVQFNEVRGDFNCSKNHLISLAGCPKKVHGLFNCNNNNLATLKGGPQNVGNYFYCDHNELISLEGAPQRVANYFSCESNQIKSLEFCPQRVGGSFYCDKNPLLGQLQTLQSFPEIYQAHLRYQLIKQEKDNLCNSINANIKNKTISKI